MERKNKNEFSVRKRIKSFGYAFNGLKILFSEEHNARIHLGVTIIVIAMGIVFGISPVEWMITLTLIALIFSLEIINSALERICDVISPEKKPAIKKIKDLSAAAVLISAIVAVVCGTIIFLPRLCDFLK
ncbi:MAG: diacylglycerol kinase family protein [Prevotella sp.]|jgi:undecaprenol kinase/diacylglycerol kinase (ATP)|nr:diacylglycerol kinase family protein [Prevotella sp.]